MKIDSKDIKIFNLIKKSLSERDILKMLASFDSDDLDEVFGGVDWRIINFKELTSEIKYFGVRLNNNLTIEKYYGRSIIVNHFNNVEYFGYTIIYDSEGEFIDEYFE